MSDRIEGTVVFDGLLEGKLPGGGSGAARLGEWVGYAAGLNLPLSLEVDGESFSVLAENRPIQVEQLGDSPAETLADALRQLFEIFPPHERARAFSTLRSTEYRKGEAVQTVYIVGSGGSVQVRERAVDARTTPGLRLLTGREKLRLGAMGVVVALLVFAVSSVFVDYRALWDNIVEEITPFDPNELVVESGSFGDYFTVEKKDVARGGKVVVLTVKRRKKFPVTDADLKRLLAEPPDGVPARLTIEALARGYVRCEYFDKHKEFMGFSMQRISRLREKETVGIALPLPRDWRLARVVITY
jgi:hypothetical protein